MKKYPIIDSKVLMEVDTYEYNVGNVDYWIITFVIAI